MNPPKDGVMVPGWVIKAGAPVILGLVVWYSSLIWDAREASVRTEIKMGHIQEAVRELKDGRYTAEQAAKDLDVRDKRLDSMESRLTVLESARRK